MHGVGGGESDHGMARSLIRAERPCSYLAGGVGSEGMGPGDFDRLASLVRSQPVMLFMKGAWRWRETEERSPCLFLLKGGGAV